MYVSSTIEINTCKKDKFFSPSEDERYRNRTGKILRSSLQHIVTLEQTDISKSAIKNVCRKLIYEPKLLMGKIG